MSEITLQYPIEINGAKITRLKTRRLRGIFQASLMLWRRSLPRSHAGAWEPLKTMRSCRGTPCGCPLWEPTTKWAGIKPVGRHKTCPYGVPISGGGIERVRLSVIIPWHRPSWPARWKSALTRAVPYAHTEPEEGVGHDEHDKSGHKDAIHLRLTDEHVGWKQPAGPEEDAVFGHGF